MVALRVGAQRALFEDRREASITVILAPTAANRNGGSGCATVSGTVIPLS